MASVVTSLPEALAPWSAWLKWFAPDLAAELGSLLQRMQPLLGAFKGQDQGGEPELQGLDDLRTRGPYERLLATEWLLADEFPDEFLRRATSGEHIFLAPRPSRRRAQRTLVALFDAGPLQVGAPRLGHIVMWILLARRAVQAQGEMRWGVLQAPGELMGAGEVQYLKALMARRSFTAPDATHLEQWQAVLDAEDCADGERWLIGSPYLSVTASAFTHRVHLHKHLEGAALEVSLVERGAERKVSLPLPRQDSVLSLLRGSFEPPTAHSSSDDTQAISLQRPPIISFDGIRIGVALRDQPAAAVINVPPSSNGPPPKLRAQRWSHGYSALSAVFAGKNINVLMSDPERLRLWPTNMQMPFPAQDQFHAPGSTAAWLPAAWLRSRDNQRFCVIDHSRRLLAWDGSGKNNRELKAQPELRLLREHALALAQLNKQLAAYAYHHDGRVWFDRVPAEGEPDGVRLICEAPPDATVLFGRGCFCAVRISPHDWRLTNWHNSAETYTARLSNELRVIGVLRDKRWRLGLLTLDDQHLRLHAVDGSHELLYTAPSRVISHTVCPNSGLVAMLTFDRQLIAFSAATHQLRLCVQTGRTRHANA